MTLSSKKLDKVIKAVDKLTKENATLEQEVVQLRNSETIANRGMQDLGARFDRFGMIFDWHSHQKIEQSGPIIFRKDEFETATGVKLNDNLQPIQPAPPVQPPQPPKEETEPEDK